MSAVAANVLKAAYKALKAVYLHACCVISLHGCLHGPWRKNGRLLEIMWGQILGGGCPTVVCDVISLSATHSRQKNMGSSH